MRTWKRIGLIGLVGVLLVCCGGAAVVGWVWNRAVLDTSGEVEFVNRLAIPPLAPSRVDENGRRVFDLRADEGRHDFGGLPGGDAVPTLGFNGAYLGPTLRAARGEDVVVNVRNELAEETTVHWHGMHLPAGMDGGPHQPIRPGQTWSPTWRIDQPAATLWYHPHLHGDTARHAYRGLAGLFILDDAPAGTSMLPSRYGVDDLPVIVQDKRFDGARLDEDNSFAGTGILGDTIAVNGTVAPYQEVATERIRLRLLNASTARGYNVGFADDRRFALVATDGGLLGEAYQVDRIALSPGERAEIVVTMRPGERAVLESTPPSLGLNAISRRFVGGADTLDILELRAARDLAASPSIPDRLGDLPDLGRAEVAQQRTFWLSDTTINGQRMDMGRVDAAAVKDTVEVWRVTNADGMPHSFHIHDVQFQVLTVDGRTTPIELRGWKDTVYLPPGREFALAVPFSDYADPDTPYMFHCHVLYHEDRGMMGQFVVVEPGQRAGTPATDHGHAHHSSTG